MKVTQTITIEQKGVGKPDYSREISLGKVRPGLSLKDKQELLIGGITFTNIASIYPWVTTPLAAGGTAHLINWATGTPLPDTSPAGYAYSLICQSRSFNQDNTLLAYFSTPDLGIPLTLSGHLGTIKAGDLLYQPPLIPVSTLLFDASATYSHQVDFVIENLGGAAMEGSVTLYFLQEEIGTEPLPTTKTVRCKWCVYEWVVPKETTSIKCPECGELNFYCDFSRIRSL